MIRQHVREKNKDIAEVILISWGLGCIVGGEVCRSSLNIPTVIEGGVRRYCAAYALWWRAKMAENNVEPENEWSNRAPDTVEDTLVAMETLLATLRAFEDVLRQQDISIASSAEYCDNFCQVMCTCYLNATPRLITLAPPRFVFIFVHFSLFSGSAAGSLAASKCAGFLEKQGAKYRCVCVIVHMHACMLFHSTTFYLSKTIRTMEKQHACCFRLPGYNAIELPYCFEPFGEV